MTVPFLLALELGPVVQIVTAARKTRDLWFGSFLMSEVSKAVAKAIANECAQGDPDKSRPPHEYLIAPAPGSAKDLEAESFIMGDEILVEIPAGTDPAAVAKVAREAAHKRWVELADDAIQRINKNNLFEPGVWEAQTRSLSGADSPDAANEVVEVYSAWVPLVGDYQTCLKRVKRLLAGRTCCRNFPPADGLDAGAPKSSLDGRRRSVLKKPDDKKKPIRNRRLRLNRGEQLDALGITKRIWGGRKNYPSTARVAADPWIRGAKPALHELWTKLIDQAKPLAERFGKNVDDPILGKLTVDALEFPSYPKYELFPYEGAILFENRQHEFLREADEEAEFIKDDDRPLSITGNNPLASFQTTLKELTKKHGAPGSYYSILMADGDNVGAALLKCSDPESHRKFSRKLSKFAAAVREIVHDKHYGALVYAAGEDVVALVPLDHCVACAEELRLKFAEDMKSVPADKPITLSVGIAIGHFLDALEDVHQAAREMLDDVAKKHPGKNALAIQYRSRGGSPIQCVRSWNSSPCDEINEWGDLLRSGKLPAKIAYDVRELARVYDRWDESPLRRRAMQADLRRLLAAKDDPSDAVSNAIDLLSSPQEVVNLANTIIIARLIADAQALSGKKVAS